MTDLTFTVEMNYCRRCGSPLEAKSAVVFVCEKGHMLFGNASPATALILLNEADEVLVLRRNIEPHKGAPDLPGGFCDGPEPSEAAMQREMEEECSITPDQYTPLEFVCTGLDPYSFGGEVLPVHATIFTARIKGQVTPRLDHENALAEFVPLRDLDIESIAFPSLRQALRIVIAKLS